jgi:hypothetical protein
MILHVKKHPDPQTLASCFEVPIGTPVPVGYEVMSLADFDAWKAAELASGWRPAAETQPVPQTITPWQLRKALNQLGLRNAVEAAIAQADQDTKDGWEFATEFRRDDEMLNAMASALGISDSELDDIFRLASPSN